MAMTYSEDESPAAVEAEMAQTRRERDECKAAHESLICELATILGPGKHRPGETREAYWIGRVGKALASLTAEVFEKTDELLAVRAERDALKIKAARLTEDSRDHWRRVAETAHADRVTLLDAVAALQVLEAANEARHLVHDASGALYAKAAEIAKATG